MAEATFRDILLKTLEENQPQPATSPSESASEHVSVRFEFDFQWRPESQPPTVKKGGYVRAAIPAPEENPSPAPTPPPPSAPTHEEIFFTHADLNTLEKEALVTFRMLGASELNAQFSLERVKSAHRRLVKSLHPDANANHSPREIERRLERFLMLQKAYELLATALKEKTRRAREKMSSKAA